MEMPRALSKLGPECRQILKRQEISCDGPGTILNDLEVLLSFIGARGIAVGGKNGNLTPSALPSLNARLSNPIEIRLDRALLQHYPNIAGIYVIARAMTLVRTDAKAARVDPSALAQWKQLNIVEKYFSLLEAWLMHVGCDAVAGDTYRGDNQFDDVLWFLSQYVGKSWKSFDEYVHSNRFRGVSNWNAQMLFRFGLVELRPRSLDGREGQTGGWMMQSAKRTEWGQAITWALLQSQSALADFFHHGENLDNDVGDDDDDDDDLDPHDKPFGIFQSVFRPYFPAYERTFSPVRSERRAGTYIIKATLDRGPSGAGAWRRLAVPSQTSLDGLAFDILKAFGFDDDHLHEFRYRDVLGRMRRYYHPYCDEGPWSSTVLVENAGLAEKQTIKFRFDFGDNWRFTLKLERIDTAASEPSQTRLLESFGEAPPQYPTAE